MFNVLLRLSVELPSRHEPRCAASGVFYACTVDTLDRHSSLAEKKSSGKRLEGCAMVRLISVPSLCVVFSS